ncbi:hypothetical protein F5050DRAFT_1847670 [Lentinula boryana]|uniref:Homeobox domain-containing protein n=1 Tax=Lentinula boryana TaxID=40481 RepID=A0ABQ8Q3L1_9AGAR|nr:hypothetical protein F5050DRAFT_1847670 [Lentinula boryana]
MELTAHNAEGLDDRLISSFDLFFNGLHNSDIRNLQLNWYDIVKDVVGSHDAGSLDSDTSSLAVSVSNCMSILCDTFLNLDIKTDEFALVHDFDLLPPDTDPTPSRSPSPSPTLPSYIPPSYAWLLSNLHNPYPTPQTRDEIASSTNTERRLIDAWFVDVRRRIGWTRLIDSNRSSHKTKSSAGVSTCTGRVKYKTRKELITASSQFFLSECSEGGRNSLSDLEIQTFSSLAETARGLYKDKLHLTHSLDSSANQSQEKKRRTRITPIKQESDSESHSDEDAFHTHLNKHSRSSTRSVSPADSLSSSLPSATPSPLPTTPTTPTFPSSSSSSSSSTLKRKRAVSSFEESLSPSLSSFSTSPISPATKRLRTALNSAGISRSVSDPTPVPRAALTFDGFPAPVLDSWFTPDQACGEGDPGLNFPEEWVDPFWENPDPIVRSMTDQVSGPGIVPPPIQPYPLQINVVDLNIYSSSSSSYDRSSTSSSASASSPSTPALSASGTLTDEDEDDNDSLFGGDDDEDHEGVITATMTKEEVEEGAGTGKPLPETTMTMNMNMITPAEILDQFNLSSSLSPSSNPPINPFTLSSLPEFNLDALPNQDPTNANGDLNVNVNVNFDFNFGLDSGLGLDLDSNFGFGFNGLDAGFGSGSGVGSYPQTQTQTQFPNQNQNQSSGLGLEFGQGGLGLGLDGSPYALLAHQVQVQSPTQSLTQSQSLGLGLPHLERDTTTTPPPPFQTTGSFESPGTSATSRTSGSFETFESFGNFGSFGSFGRFEDLDVFFQVPQSGNANANASANVNGGSSRSPSASVGVGASVPWAGPTPTRETFGVGVSVGV